MGSSLYDREIFFAPAFLPLRGKRVGLTLPPGNVGDVMIADATKQMMEEFGIRWREVQWPDMNQQYIEDHHFENIEVLVHGGGGNMGNRWWHQEARRHLLKIAKNRNIPTVCLPQSYDRQADDEDKFGLAYVRDAYSMHYARGNKRLMPDLALGYECPFYVKDAEFDVGVHLRTDKESIFGERPADGWACGGPEPGNIRNDGDPVKMVDSLEAYFHLAARYKHIITDRLHFAIAGLILNRQVTLVPGITSKNLGTYQCWLWQLGCKFSLPLSLEEVTDASGKPREIVK